MAKTPAEISKQFRNEMQVIIDTFKGYETSFYNTYIEPNRSQLSKGEKITQDNFPTYLHRSIYAKLYSNKIDIDEYWNRQLDTNLTLAERKKGITISMKKGESFEDLSWKLMQNNKFIQSLIDKTKLQFTNVAGKRLREDIKMTEEFSFDFKWSDYEGFEDRLKTIIKGSNDFQGKYNGLVDIENNIIKSLYSTGAKAGEDAILWKPKTKTLQIGNASANLIFVFKEDAYWTSLCLQKLVDWAAHRIIETEWKNVNLRARDSYKNQADKETSINYHTKQGFWYGRK